MSHEVEQMMFVGEVPWHGLGTQLEENPSVAEAIVAAGLDWEVKLKPLAVYERSVDDGEIVNTITNTDVPARATIRSSDNAVLGVVGNRYTPLQNIDAFNFFQPFIDADQASLHTAGSLREGKRIWILAKLNRDNSVIVKGDEVSKFLMLSHSHDGSLSVQVGFTPIRVVCANTLAMAHGNKASKLLRIRHTKQLKTGLEHVREAMDTANAQFEATADLYRQLASSQINSKDLEKYVKVVTNQEGKKLTEISTKTKKVMNDIKRRFEAGKGNKEKNVRGTWWAAYNAVTEHLTWKTSRTKDTRFNKLWFSSGESANDRAFKTALKMAA